MIISSHGLSYRYPPPPPHSSSSRDLAPGPVTSRPSSQHLPSTQERAEETFHNYSPTRAAGETLQGENCVLQGKAIDTAATPPPPTPAFPLCQPLAQWHKMTPGEGWRTNWWQPTPRNPLVNNGGSAPPPNDRALV